MEAGLPPAEGQIAGRLQPLRIGESIDAAIKLYRSQAVALWKAVAIVIVPLQVVQVIVTRVSLPSDVFVHDGSLYTFSGNGTAGTGGTVALILVGFLGLLGSLLATGAVFKLLLDAYLGRTPDWRESLAFARPRVGGLLWLGILTVVIVVIGFVLIIVPGIWLLVSFAVAVPALMQEDVRGLAALRRSRMLVRGHWWLTFARVLVAIIIAVLALAVLGAILKGIVDGITTNVTLFLSINGLVNAIATIVYTPFVAAVTTVIYIDLRVRKEALDLELLAAGATAPVVTPSLGG
jgi:hypothetical protein